MTKLMSVEASRVHGAVAGCSTVAQVSAVYEFNGGGELLPCGARRGNDGGEELRIKGERNGSGSWRIIYLWVREVEQRIPRPAERSAMAGLRSCRTTRSEEGERELTRGPRVFSEHASGASREREADSRARAAGSVRARGGWASGLVYSWWAESRFRSPGKPSSLFFFFYVSIFLFCLILNSKFKTSI
jgi:hypothetical protein